MLVLYHLYSTQVISGFVPSDGESYEARSMETINAIFTIASIY